MKILYAISALAGGGAETFTVQLACTMAARKDQVVHLVTYAGCVDDKGKKLKELLKSSGVIYHSPNVKQNWIKFLLPFYYALLMWKINPQVVHSNLDHTDLLVALGKHFFSCKKICFVRTIHSIVNAENTFSKPVMKWLFSQFDYNIACSDFVKNNYIYPEMRKNMISINNGIIMEQTNHYKGVREELNIREDELVFLQIGSLAKRVGDLPKAHDIVFKAFKDLRELQCKVLFVGDNSNIENDYPKDLYEDPRFIFLGLKTNVYPYIQAADLLLAPSRFEGLPISTIEAVCQGLPLLCSDIEGFSAFKGTSTVICKTESVESLKDKINYCVLNLKNLQKEGEKNMLNYRNRFDIENVLDQYEVYYSKQTI